MSDHSHADIAELKAEVAALSAVVAAVFATTARINSQGVPAALLDCAARIGADGEVDAQAVRRVAERIARQAAVADGAR